uniref:Threonyl/alanyl tRNA synthetase SAD domain-containing protein n=1 Tax=Hucho hucho TaxID=62062 RepID=A0A4W5JJV2_9TELE
GTWRFGGQKPPSLPLVLSASQHSISSIPVLTQSLPPPPPPPLFPLPLSRGVSSNDFPCLENLCKKIIKEKQPFERLEIKKETLLEMFKYNTFKCRILNEKVTTPTTTVYRCGPLIDLCRGPHVRHTGKIKALKIHKKSSTYWEDKADVERV